jgi:hypothetical protein
MVQENNLYRGAGPISNPSLYKLGERREEWA